MTTKGSTIQRLRGVLAAAALSILVNPLLSPRADAAVSGSFTNIQTTYLSTGAWSLSWSTNDVTGTGVMSSATIVISTDPAFVFVYSSFSYNASQAVTGLNVSTISFNAFASPAPSTATTQLGPVALGALPLSPNTTYYFAIKNSSMTTGDGSAALSDGTRDTNYIVLSTVTYVNLPTPVAQGATVFSTFSAVASSFSITVSWNRNGNSSTSTITGASGAVAVVNTTYTVVLSTMPFDFTLSTPCAKIVGNIGNSPHYTVSITTQPLDFGGNGAGNISATVGISRPQEQLIPNTSYYACVLAWPNAVTVLGGPPRVSTATIPLAQWLALSSTHTAPAPPVAPGWQLLSGYGGGNTISAANYNVGLASSQVQVAWDTNGNPPGTLFVVLVSTKGGGPFVSGAGFNINGKLGVLDLISVQTPTPTVIGSGTVANSGAGGATAGAGAIQTGVAYATMTGVSTALFNLTSTPNNALLGGTTYFVSVLAKSLFDDSLNGYQFAIGTVTTQGLAPSTSPLLNMPVFGPNSFTGKDPAGNNTPGSEAGAVGISSLTVNFGEVYNQDPGLGANTFPSSYTIVIATSPLAQMSFDDIVIAPGLNGNIGNGGKVYVTTAAWPGIGATAASTRIAGDATSLSKSTASLEAFICGDNGVPASDCLAGNTTYYAYVNVVNTSATVPGASVDSLGGSWLYLGSTHTLAALPFTLGAPVQPVIYITSATLYAETNSFGPGGNNAASAIVTTYTVVVTTAGSVANVNTIVSFAGTVNLNGSLVQQISTAPAPNFSVGPGNTIPQITLTNLQANTTYFVYYNPINHDGLGTGFFNMGTITTLPNTPSGGSFTAGYTTMTVTWTNGAGPQPSSFSVIVSTIPSASDILNLFPSGAVTATGLARIIAPYTLYLATGGYNAVSGGAISSVTFSGLNLNTNYYIYIAAVNQSQSSGTLVALGSAQTLPAPPAVLSAAQLAANGGASTLSSTFTNVGAGQFSVVWSTMGYLAPFADPGSGAPGFVDQTTYSVVFATFAPVISPLGGVTTGAGAPLTLAQLQPSGQQPTALNTISTAPVSYNNGPAMVTVSGINAPGIIPGTNYFPYVAACPAAGCGASTTYVFMGTATTSGGLAAPAPNSSGNYYSTATAASLTPQWSVNGNPVPSSYSVILSTYPSALNTVVTSMTLVNNSAASTVAVSTTANTLNPTATISGLLADTTYYLYVATSGVTPGALSYVNLGSTSTLANVPTAASFGTLWFTSATVTWTPGANANPNPGLQISSFNVVLSTMSTLATFLTNYYGGSDVLVVLNTVNQSTTPVNPTNGTQAAPQATFAPGTIANTGNVQKGAGLIPNAVYYLYIGAQNWSSAIPGFGLVTNWAGPLANGTLSAAQPSKTDANNVGVGTTTINAGGLAIGWSSGTVSVNATTGQGFNALNNSTYTVLLTRTNGASTLASAPSATAANDISLSTVPVGPQPQAIVTASMIATSAYPASSGGLANTTYYAYVQANGANGVNTQFVELATAASFANTPAALATSAPFAAEFISVSSGSVVVAWGANGNPIGGAPTSTTTYKIAMTTVSVVGDTLNRTLFANIAPVSITANGGANVMVTTAPIAYSNATTQALQAQVGNVTNPLNANTLYYLWGESVNMAQISTGAVRMGSTVTAVAPPLNFGSSLVSATPSTFTVALVSQIGSGFLTINWQNNSNPGNVTTYNVVLTSYSLGASPSAAAVTAAAQVSVSTAPSSAAPSAFLSTDNNGLGGNTTYFFYINAVGQAGGQSAYVSFGSTVTYARMPIGLPATNVGFTGFTGNWGAGGSSTSTYYDAQVSTNNFQTLNLETYTQATSLTLTGLLSGQNYNLRVRAVNYDGSLTGFTTSPPVTTLGASVAAPTAAAVTYSVVYTSGITVNWADTVNSSATYSVQISTDPSFVNVNNSSTTLNKFAIFGQGANGITAQGTTLNPATPYYFQVQSVNAATGQTSIFTSLGGTGTLANAPINTSTPTAGSGVWLQGVNYGNLIAASSATIIFNNNTNPSTTTAEIQLATGASSNLFTTWTSSFGIFNNQSINVAGAPVLSSFTPVNLIGCTQYSARTRFYSPFGAPSAFDTNVVTFTTLQSTPGAPGGLVALPNTNNTITLMWSASPTEGISAYNLYATTSAVYDASNNILIISTGATTASGSSYRNQTLMISLSTATLNAAASPALTGTGFNTSGLYQYTVGPLPGGTTDRFHISAVHRCGLEEAAGSETIAVASNTVANARATLAQPLGGALTAGGSVAQGGSNNLTVQASILPYTAGGVTYSTGAAAQVIFQFQDTDADAAASNNAWITIDTVTAAPWSSVFDVTAALGAVSVNHSFVTLGGTALPVQAGATNGTAGNPTGKVSIRVVAYDIFGSSDPSPVPSIVTLINAGNALASLTPNFVAETANPLTLQVVKSQVLSNTSPLPQTLSTTGGAGGTTLGLSLPAGAFTTPNGAGFVALQATPNPPAAIANTIPAPSGTSDAISNHIVSEICLGTINTLTGACNVSGVSLANPATLSMSYTPFANGDITIPGVGGGDSGLAPSAAAVFSTPNTATAFIADATGNTVNATNNTISATTAHFSFFGIFAGVKATAFTDLSQVRVYPVPWKPNGSDANLGRPFIPGSTGANGLPNTGIVFDQLPSNVTIKIYTITGQRVTAQTISGGNGIAQWDGRNDDGRPVATGGYFAVISSNGSSITKRLAIIR